MWSDHRDEYIKGKGYVLEPKRFVQVGRDAVIWEGPSCSHFIFRSDDEWCCDCIYASLSYLPCSHVRALEELLQNDQFFLESITLDRLKYLEWVPIVWSVESLESCPNPGAN